MLKRGLKPSCTILPLMKKDHADNLRFLLGSVGRLHLAGWVCALTRASVGPASCGVAGPRGPRLGLRVFGEVVGSGCDGGPRARCAPNPLPTPSIDINPNGLFPPEEFPAPRGTPLISPLIKWDHSQTWDVPAAEDFPNGSSSSSATVYTIGEPGRGEAGRCRGSSSPSRGGH